MIRILWLCAVTFALISCSGDLKKVEQWRTHEIALTAEQSYENAYRDVEVWAEFRSGKGQSLLRPAFWDGVDTWKIRFAPPDAGSRWEYRTFASAEEDAGLHGKSGAFLSVPYSGQNRLLQHGLLKMSPGKRNVVHHSGKPFLVVGDTPWALPFRATVEDARTYARDRQAKGFNAALLMTVQPDRDAEGPEARNTPLGFARGFRDLPEGHLNQLNPGYFQYMDSLMMILVDHEIVPVYQPVFHGFGWKGLNVLGWNIDADEYVRYCKYLLARYGSMPAMWLLSGDSNGKNPGVRESGEMMEEWDCYAQPAGLHYNPFDDYVADWATEDNNPCMHFNKSYQDAEWLDFQWAQTGHGGEHLYHKVERMYENLPVKAAANGEPTYEGMGGGKYGLGWWQGEDAWMQLMSGGTMGVLYGAASLWQWKITADEPGWGEWSSQQKSWKEALEMEGSGYVGLVSKAFEGHDFIDMIKLTEKADSGDYLLGKPDRFYISYINNGGRLSVRDLPEGLSFSWFNPRTGQTTAGGKTEANAVFQSPDDNPWILIIYGEVE